MIIERCMEMNTTAHACFIDFSKAFDCVKHDKLMEILKGIGVEEKDLQFLNNIHWTQIATVRTGGKLTDFKKIEKVSGQVVYYPRNCLTFTAKGSLRK